MFEKAPQTQLALGTPPDLTPYPTRAVSSLAADQRTRWLRMRALELLVVGVLAASFMWTTRAEAQDSLLQCMAGVLCGNECVDTSRDAQHCGGCGTACTAGAICDAGACVVPTVPALADTPGFDITLRLGAAGIINSENYPLEGFFGGLEGYGKGLWASLALRRRTARGSSFGVMLGRVTASSPIEDVSRLAGVSGGLDLRLRLARFAVGAHAISLFIPVQAGLLWWRSEFGSEASLSLLDFYVRGGLGSEFTLMSRVSVGFEVSFGVRAGIFAQVSESYEDDQDLYEGIDDGVERLSAAPWLVSLAVTLHMGTPRPAPVPPPAARTTPELLALVLSQHATDADGLSVEITATERFRAAFAGYRHVALVAPTTCINESAAVASGSAHSREQVLRTQCGVEMAELERALAQAGYRVTSWRTMADAMARGSQTAVEVARAFGSQVVFQVNSLERSQAEARFVQRTNWSFHQTDPSGATGPQIAVSAADAEQLRQIANAYLASRHQATAGHAATLDVVAIDVASNGESVWFYRGQLVEELTSTRDARVMVRGTPRTSSFGGASFDWSPVDPIQQVGVQVVNPTTSTGGTQTVEYGGGPSDPTRALEQRIMRTLVADFVQRFRTGTEGTAP